MQILFTQAKEGILDIKPDKRTDVWKWGSDNLHPSLTEALINGSVTAKAASNKVAKAIYGKSFGEKGGIIVNQDGQTLNEVLRIAGREYAKHNNAFIWIGYNSSLKVRSIKVIPATQVRKGKSDDLGYSGKFLVKQDWSDKKTDPKVYDTFNPIEEVVKAQFAHQKGKHKGQILHLQEDANAIYSLSDLFSVQSEALLESNSQTFRSNGAINGFLSTKILMVKPFADNESRNAFNRQIQKVKGVENTGGVLVMESDKVGGELDKEMRLEDMTSEFDDKLFKYSDEIAERNIAKAFGVPLALINSSESGLFGNSGELLRQAKQILFEDQEESRDMLESTFNRLMGMFTEPVAGLQIINPYTETI